MAARVAACALAALALGCEARSAAAPEQPIPFGHRIHVETNPIGCTMCHVYAEHSSVAGIPSMQRCWGCHKFVSKDKPTVQAVVKAYDQGHALEWVRVHRLPDHVFFSHEPHVAGGIACRECHGEVAKMETARQVVPLTMGFCVECHQRRSATLDCLGCHK
jgi:hypothetical protein